MKQEYPPAYLLQHIANSPSLNDFINSFEPVRNLVKGYLKDAGFEFSQFKSILDFGCGVGRFLFAFESELAPDQKLQGCDVYEECARWCQKNISFVEVKKTNIEPPLPYQDSEFDLVYAHSVYTHLNLEMQFRWAWEIYRILRPGGVLFVTIHGPFFFPVFFETLRGSAKSAEFNSFGDDSFFAYLSFRGKTEDEGQVHVASAHTPSFFHEQFSAFDVVKRVPQSLLAGGQDLYVIRKPLHGRSIERPILLKPDSNQVVWTQQISKASNAVSLQFNCNGHRTFRVYPCVQPAGIYGVGCKLIAKAGANLLVEKEVRFNNNKVFGQTHYGILEFDVPEYKGALTIELFAQIIDQGTLSVDDKASISWSFPSLT